MVSVFVGVSLVVVGDGVVGEVDVGDGVVGFSLQSTFTGQLHT